jgi:hypothetical protein
MIKSLLSILTIACCLAVEYVSAAPVYSLDQANMINTEGGSVFSAVSDLSDRAQTITVGRSGLLTRVELQLCRWQTGPAVNGTTEDLSFQVSRPVSSTVPVGTPLATVVLHPSQIGSVYDPIQWVTFDFSDSPVPVTSGQVISLLLTSRQSYLSEAFYAWVITQAIPVDYYTRGAAWERNNNEPTWAKTDVTQDFSFRTYISPVPEPSALAVVVLGAMTWLSCRLRTSSLRR